METRNPRANVIQAIAVTRRALVETGIVDPDALKRRDKREPGRRRKEKAEQRMAAVLLRYWRAQARRIRAILERYAPERKTYVPVWAFENALGDEKLEAQLIMEMMLAAQDGVGIFAGMVNIGLDYTLVNTAAAEWARDYGFDWIDGINNTTRQALQTAVASFVDTPGFTVRDVMNMLPFGESRAMTVATTEITRAYATATEIAGNELAKEFPGVRVVKTWYTNNDDRVCPICAPLDGMTVEINEGFTTEADKALGISAPPAHVNCRCWMSSSTRLESD